MNVVYLVAFFILGTILGSFFHVVGLRLSLNQSIVYPGSHCDFCNHPLKISDLIPIFSFVFQKGKCKYCHKKLSFMHPIVEFSCGLLFAISYYSFGFTWDLVMALGVVSLFIIVMVSDLNYLIIPDEVVVFFAIYFAITLFLKGSFLSLGLGVISGLFLFIVMYLLMCLGNYLFKKESLGGGDIKLMFLVGMVLGPFLGLFNIFLASVLALPMSIFLYLRKKENVIPFGPFILLAFLLLFFLKIDLSTIETLLNF